MMRNELDEFETTDETYYEEEDGSDVYYKDIIINVPEVDGLVVPGKFKLIGTRVVDQDNPKNFAVIVNRIERN